MTIPDMANSFQFSSTRPTIAAIHCDGPRQNANAFGSLSDLQDSSLCYNPKFIINRDLIMLPIINQTATKVHARIIPQPNGDCRLLDDAANSQVFGGYNVTVTGLPVSIACNITAVINVDGTMVPLAAPTLALSSGVATASTFASSQPASSSDNLQLSSPGNASTNGVAGAYISPPAPKHFEIPFNETNSVCFQGPSAASACFPGGVYVPQTGEYGYSTINITSMTIPNGASIHINVSADQTYRSSGYIIQSTFSSSADASHNPDWALSFGRFNAQVNHGIMAVTTASPPLPPAPPAACFFSQTNFNGQLFCLGLGGGNLSDQQRNTAQSVRVFGGAKVYLFAQSGYGDGSETAISSDIADLRSEPYGTNDNLAGKVKAVWITGAV